MGLEAKTNMLVVLTRCSILKLRYDQYKQLGFSDKNRQVIYSINKYEEALKALHTIEFIIEADQLKSYHEVLFENEIRMGRPMRLSGYDLFLRYLDPRDSARTLKKMKINLTHTQLMKIFDGDLSMLEG